MSGIEGQPARIKTAGVGVRKPPVPDHATHRMGRPPKAARKLVRKTDITLPKPLIEEMKVAARGLGVSILEYGRLAVKAYARFLVFNPDAVTPMIQKCEACGRPYKATRTKDGKGRVRAQVHFDEATNEAMLFVADNYYHGVFSRSFEASILHFMDPKAAPLGGGA